MIAIICDICNEPLKELDSPSSAVTYIHEIHGIKIKTVVEKYKDNPQRHKSHRSAPLCIECLKKIVDELHEKEKNKKSLKK
jgi:hypothetical protein